MTELRRLRREHAKALRLWRSTRKPRHWKAMRDLTTAIVKISALSPRSVDSTSQNTQGRLQ